MFHHPFLPLIALLAFTHLAKAADPTPRTPPLPRVFILDAQHLAITRDRIRSHDSSPAGFAQAEIAQLKTDANRALTAGPFSVTTKSAVPPSGDKHDYISQGPYWWPDPKSSNGLPYIRRDGEINPEWHGFTDHANLGKMNSAVRTLALAYYFTGEERYAAAATTLLRTWFLNPATLMNPNLKFGQGIPGITTGRGVGLIDTTSLPHVVDSIGLLAGSKAWTDADQRGMEKWFGEFLDWMLTSKYGRDEAAAQNNHGTYYDVQAASFALFVNKPETARKILQDAPRTRIAVQIQPDGSQPLELERTKSWSYSTMNLRGLIYLAILAEHVNVDLWNFSTPDGRSIRKAIDFMIPFAVQNRKWPHKQISGRPDPSDVQPFVAIAAAKFPNSQYNEILAQLPAPTGKYRLLIGPGAFFSAGSSTYPPRLFLLDPNAIVETRRAIRSGTTNFNAAIAKLTADATSALTNGPYSVINKEPTPPSGDKHDYMSLAPYYWPNPDTTNGLPYVRRDGQRNPEIYKIPNRLHLGELADTLDTLALAYYFTENEIFAQRCALLIRTWFLDPATRMNPNLQFGQAIKGVNTGRGIGIIETRSFVRVIDSVGLIAGSPAWTSTDQLALEKWFDAYLEWMLQSQYGRDEAAAKNNHGTYYDVQVATFAFFIGKPDIASNVLANVGSKRIAVQVEPDGSQPMELERTRAWSYSVGNLAGLVALARLADHAAIDLWNFQTTDGRSIRKAIDFLLPFGLGQQKWPYKQIDGWSPDIFYPILRIAAAKYPDAPYRSALDTIPGPPIDSQSLLMLSPLEPINRLHLKTKESD